MNIDERVIRAAITLLGDAGNEKVGAIVAECGIHECSEQWLSGIGPAYVVDRFPTLLKRAERELDKTADFKARFIIPSDDEWPSQLDDLDFGQPVGLWLKGTGHLSTLSQRMLAIVGARASTSYGERIASELASQVAGIGVTTISGAAYGIDAAAHRGSLAVGGPTVAVLACGVDVAYPAAHSGLLERIADGGLIVSEAGFGASPHKRHFLVRNRLIAALSSTTVVVEAALRSGSLSTSNWAAAIGRDVWGVPGPLTSATSAGVHRAIHDGVMKVMTDYGDVLRQFPAMDSPSLGDLEEHVVALLKSGVTSLNDLVRLSDGLFSRSDVLAIVTLLEVTQRARCNSDRWTLI